MNEIRDIGKRCTNDQEMQNLIVNLCQWQPMDIRQLARLLNRKTKSIKKYIHPLLISGRLSYTIPEMPNHPYQKYQKPANKAD